MSTRRYILLTEVLSELHVERDFIRALEEEGVVEVKLSTDGEPVMSAADVERVRLAQLLTSELEVNLAGVEVVVHMREEMLAMRRQFSEILETMVLELRRHLGR
jgi:MerR family transcriptional regulator/heat shock protein HspR